jgi:hypothetical protein
MTITNTFDIEKLRLSPATAAATTVKKILSIPVHKPPRHDWIRVHPQEKIDVGGVILKDGDDELYLVEPDVAEVLGDEVVFYSMFPYINRVRVLRLWPVRLPPPDGREMDWHRTARAAAARAIDKWVRVAANRSLGAYDVFEAVNQPADPDWPDLTLPQMIKLAFHDRGRIIRDMDHPVVQTLLGQL